MPRYAVAAPPFTATVWGAPASFARIAAAWDMSDAEGAKRLVSVVDVMVMAEFLPILMLPEVVPERPPLALAEPFTLTDSSPVIVVVAAESWARE